MTGKARRQQRARMRRAMAAERVGILRIVRTRDGHTLEVSAITQPDRWHNLRGRK